MNHLLLLLRTNRQLQWTVTTHTTLTSVLNMQVEFADLLLVNKTDCVSKEDLEKLISLLSELNPKAQVRTQQFVPCVLVTCTLAHSSFTSGWLPAHRLTRVTVQPVDLDVRIRECASSGSGADQAV